MMKRLALSMIAVMLALITKTGATSGNGSEFFESPCNSFAIETRGGVKVVAENNPSPFVLGNERLPPLAQADSEFAYLGKGVVCALDATHHANSLDSATFDSPCTIFIEGIQVDFGMIANVTLARILSSVGSTSFFKTIEDYLIDNKLRYTRYLVIVGEDVGGEVGVSVGVHHLTPLLT
ncbi:MAG: hypothetical protein LBJ92_03045 [Holosporales bacterium]|jgi:hypothetical protein|nr:hypothetical protein [Holosporales bacterium]